MESLKIGVILSSTRKGRVSPQVGDWVMQLAKKYQDVDFSLIDINEFNLPFVETTDDMTQVHKFSDTINELDGFIFVLAEYNHSMPPAIKNAIDSLKAPWYNKVAGIVSYGSSYGVRSAEHLRAVLTELRVANVRTQVLLSLFDDFTNYIKFTPRNIHQVNFDEMMTQLIAWSKALKPIRKNISV
jgi:NAD(P)H-dependent FMN reductase